MSTDQNALRDVFTGFYAGGDFVSAEPYGTGHINDTYRVQASQAGTPVHYLMQRINHDIFKQPDGVMDNIVRVTHHLRAKMAGAPDASRRALTVIPAGGWTPGYVTASAAGGVSISSSSGAHV